MRKFLWTLAIVSALVACTDGDGNGANATVTTALDYSDSRNWFQTEREIDTSLKDVFYVIPTAGESWVNDKGEICHYLDVNNADHRKAMEDRFNLALSIFGDGTNFFSPYYRQIVLEVWEAGDAAINHYYPAAFADVKAAFDYYMKHWNGGREFVLAGFSQGAKGVKELVKTMSDEEFSRMKAAYVIGFPVLQEDVDATDRFVPAQGAADTGVTISYNSVTGEEGIGDIFRNSKMIINPANWSTGSEVAQISVGVSNYVNREHMMLFVEGEGAEAYAEAVYQPALSKLFPLGNLHLMELPLYKDYLRENVKLRLYGE